MKRTMFCSLLILALLCGLIPANADPTFSDGCLARFAARDALKSTYGLTDDTLCYFNEALGKTEEGWIVRYYSCVPEMDYVLGRYEVTVTDGGAKPVWSWDGADMSDDLAGDAWGCRQLDTIWLYNHKTADMEGYYRMAAALARTANPDNAGYQSDIPRDEMLSLYGEYEEDAIAGSVSESDAFAIARSAVIARFRLKGPALDSLRTDSLLSFRDRNSANEAVLVVIVIAWDEEVWDAGCGQYQVAVNLVTGLVEDIAYNDGIIGNG